MVEIAVLNILPNTEYGYQMFNLCFTLITAFGIVTVGFVMLVKVLTRS